MVWAREYSMDYGINQMESYRCAFCDHIVTTSSRPLTFWRHIGKIVEPPIHHPIEFNSNHHQLHDKMAPKVDLTTVGLIVTSTFYFLTSKSNQFIYVPKCTKIVGLNLVKCSQAVYKIHIVFTKFGGANTYRRTPPNFVNTVCTVYYKPFGSISPNDTVLTLAEAWQAMEHEISEKQPQSVKSDCLLSRSIAGRTVGLFTESQVHIAQNYHLLMAINYLCQNLTDFLNSFTVKPMTNDR